MEFLKESQHSFIQNEIWMLTFGGAFQRANVYKLDVPSKDKLHFKTMTRGFIENVVLGDYKNGKVDDQLHLANINKVSGYSSDFSKIFENGKINFGIAQKILNLYLKYMWSLGHIQEPPHFPVDRIIQIKLIEQSRRLGIKPFDLQPWTQFDDELHYLKVIGSARDLILNDESYSKHSLAELELQLFDRR